MTPTSSICQFDELNFINLFDNFTPFVPETPILKAKEYDNKQLF